MYGITSQYSFSGHDWSSSSQHEKVPQVVKMISFWKPSVQKSLNTNSNEKDA